MPEQVAFPAPIAAPGPTTFRVGLLVLDAYNESVLVELREWTGSLWGVTVERVTETGPAAVALLTSLNKADLTVKSLHTRALEWARGKLIAQGKAVSGNISGSVP